MTVEIIREECISCGKCVPACPEYALHMEEIAVVTPSRCLDCGACIDECPTTAIRFKPSPVHRTSEAPLPLLQASR